MGRVVPDNVPELGGAFPQGMIDFEIEGITEEHHDDGRLYYKSTKRALAPAGVAGMPYFEQFYIGTHEDPEAENDDTWKKSFGAQALRTIAAKCDVPWTGDIEEIIAALRGQKITYDIIHQVEPTEKKDKATGMMVANQYAGSIRDKVRARYTYGKKEAFLREDDSASAPAAPKAAPPPTRAAAPPRAAGGAARP